MKSAIFNNSRLWPLFIFAISFLLYSNTLSHDYALDDYSVILNHKHVQNGIDGIDEILKTNHLNGNSGFNDGLYRPLSLISFALEEEFFDNSPFIGHFLNLLFYGLANVLLFLALRDLFRERNTMIPFLIVILFSIHPIHTEVVANIKGRDDLYAFFGFALALWAFVKALENNKLSYVTLGVFGFCLALFSKESAVLFAVLIPLILYMRSDFELKKIITLLALLLPLCTLFLLLRNSVISQMPQAVDAGLKGILNNPIAATDNPDLRWGSSFFLQILFLAKLIFPLNLISDYSYNSIPLNGIVSLKGIAGLLVLLSLSALSIWGLIKRNIWGILAAIYLVSIAIASQLLLTIGTHFGERLLFFSVLPLAMAFVFVLEKWLSKKGGEIKNPQKLFILALCPALFFVPKTIQRNAEWENNYSLYSRDLKKAEQSARLNYNYGTESYQQALINRNQQDRLRQLNEAVKHLTLAIKIYPDYYDAINNLALAVREQGRFAESVKIIEEGIKRNPNYNKYYLNLALNSFDAGQYSKSIENLTIYQSRKGEQADLYLLMGKAAGHLGDFNQAINYLNYARNLEPNNVDVLHFMGMAYGQMGNHQQAQEILKQAMQLSPNNTDILFALSISLHQLNKLSEEQQVLQKILSLNPNHQGALANINR